MLLILSFEQKISWIIIHYHLISWENNYITILVALPTEEKNNKQTDYDWLFMRNKEKNNLLHAHPSRFQWKSIFTTLYEPNNPKRPEISTVTRYRATFYSLHTGTWLIDSVGFNDTSTLVGHFVKSPREREKRNRRDSRGDEREVQGRKRNRNESEETEEIKTFHPLLSPATRIASLAQLEPNIIWTPQWRKIPDTFATPNQSLHRHLIWSAIRIKGDVSRE